jgi:transcriptional regulator
MVSSGLTGSARPAKELVLPFNRENQGSMYTPPKFQVKDPALVEAFIRENPLGLLLSCTDGEIHDTHTPFLLREDGTLIGHIARANPQWKCWEKNNRVKVIFTGPHAYISPRYYATEFNVPTWNYTAVSVSGLLSLVEDETNVLEFLYELVARNETSDPAWKLDREDARYLQLLSAIIVFSISPDHIDASFKLNQNKSREDRKSVVDALSGSGCPHDLEVATLMNRILDESEDARNQPSA